MGLHMGRGCGPTTTQAGMSTTVADVGLFLGNPLKHKMISLSHTYRQHYVLSQLTGDHQQYQHVSWQLSVKLLDTTQTA